MNIRQHIKNSCIKALLTLVCSCLITPGVQAAQPLWTFAPQTPTDISLSNSGTAQVSYTVQNQSSKAKILVMKPIAGVSQNAPCQLAPKGSCTLTLTINGTALQGDVLGGPVLCQQGSPLQCYQPSSANSLRVRLTEQPAVQQYTVTSSAGPNGSIAPAVSQVVNAGTSLMFTATADAGFGINQWLLDGIAVQTGGSTYQLNNITSDHVVSVTFGQATLSPLTQNLALSIVDAGADPALTLVRRSIIITNTGSGEATGLQVDNNDFPLGTEIFSNTCVGTLIAGSSCTITITPGSAASSLCTTAPGTAPFSSIVTVSADNASSTDINVLVLGYGCIYQGGYLFSVDNSTPSTSSIGGKVAAQADQSTGTVWGPLDEPVTGIDENSNAGVNSCDGKNDGQCNTLRIINANLTPPVAAQLCENLVVGDFNDWYMPAICELGRYAGSGTDFGCGNLNPNLYTTLKLNNLGDFADADFWSSTGYSGSTNAALGQSFADGFMFFAGKSSSVYVRCIRALSP